MFSNLDNIRPALKSLVAALREDYPYASVLAVEDAWRRWSVSRQGVSIDASGFGGGTGFVVRVFDGVGCAEYSFNEFSEERIPEIASTLARRLAERWGWSVLHMDHFFLRPEQRSPERYARPGGNVDHERFLKEVLLPLRCGERPVYRPFDCHRQKLLPPIPFEPGPVVLVEGSYACHPALWDCYDLRAVLTVGRETQMERIVRREGRDYAQVFRERWIPLEERYFSACEVERRCDYRLEA